MILSFLALLQQPNLDAKIDFSRPINVLSKTLAELELATGAKLTATPALGKEVIAVIASQQTGKEIMDRLAHVLHAKWQKTGKEYTLFRPEKEQSELWTKHVDLRSKRIQEALDSLPKPQRATDPQFVGQQIQTFVNAFYSGGNFNFIESEKLAMQTPAYQYALKLVRSLPIRDLAAVPAGTKVVFSSEPNKMQRRLPNSWREGFDQMREAQNKVVEIAGSETRDRSNPPYIPLEGSIDRIRSIPPGSEVLVIYPNPTQLSASYIRVRIVRPDGIVASDVRVNFPQPTGGASGPSDNDKTLVELTEETKKLFAYRFSLDTEEPGPEPDLRCMKYPEEDEPLRYANQEALEAIAKKERKPLIAVLDDRTYPTYVVQQFTIGNYRRMVSRLLEFAEKDGWIEVSPVNTYSTELHRLDRKMVGRFLRRYAEESRLSLANYADLLGELKVPYRSIWPPAVIQKRLSVPYEWNENEDVVRFAGSIGDSEWENLNEIDAARLSESRRRLLERALLNSAHVSLDQPDRVSKGPLFFTALGEMTELIPNGLQTPIVLTTRRTEEKTFQLKFKTDWMEVPLQHLAHESIKPQRPDLWPNATLTDTYTKALKLSFDFQVRFAGSITASMRLNDTMPDPSSKPFTLKEVPEDIKAEFEDLQKRYLQHYQGKTAADLARANGSPPPPPR